MQDQAQINTDRTGAFVRGQSKITRYGWNTDTERGVLSWVDKHSITVPEELYQRDQSDQERKIRSIAREFSWPAYGTLSLARNGDTLHCFDGAGRLMAALRREDITEVPTIIFNLDSLGAEAKAFIAANTWRKPVSAVDKHRAHVVAESPEALLVQELVAQSGRHLARVSSKSTICCVRRITGHVRRDYARLQRLWPLMLAVCEGHPLNERIVDGFMYIDKHMGDGELLTDLKWKRRLLSLKCEALVVGANRASAFFARGGERVWATGIVEVVNKGLRAENRLTLTELP